MIGSCAPLALVERNGLTIAAAQKLNRRWIGIDVTHLAIGLIRHRLRDSYGDCIADAYRVIGEPVSVQTQAWTQIETIW